MAEENSDQPNVNHSANDLRLRPEAGAMQWATLNESQREAFRRVLYMLDEAIDSIPEGPRNPDEFPELIQQKRTSHVAFISGARGSGKSSVMLSLMNAIIDPQTLIPYKSIRNKFDGALSNARKNAVWLEPIDLDPLPKPFSLIPSILDRVAQAIFRINRYKKLESTRDLEDFETTIDFQSVYRHATLAWDSNIDSRKAHLDPDSYSLEMQQTNGARLSLSQQFDWLLSQLGDKQLKEAGFTQPLFVVPIDDFDLHPTAAEHILRILRMLSSPRVFYLLLGDVQILELMMDLTVSSEIGEVIGVKVPSKTLGIEPDQIAKLGGSISRNALRKLLPSEQRIRLDTPSMCEGLLHRPSTISKESKLDYTKLYLLCNSIPFWVDSNVIGDAWRVTGSSVVTMLDYFFHPGICVLDSGDSNPDKKNLGPNELHHSYAKVLDAIDEVCKANDSSLQESSEQQKIVRTFKQLLLEEPPEKHIRFFDKSAGSQEFRELSESTGEREELGRVRQLDDYIHDNFAWANHLFGNTPRRLTDLWFTLRRRVAWLERAFRQDTTLPALIRTLKRFDRDFVADLATICRDLLLEETAFSPLERERITASMTPSTIGDFNWSELPLRLVAITEEAIAINGDSWASNRKSVPIEAGRVRNLYHEIRVHRVEDWAVVAKELDTPSQKGEPQLTSSAQIESIDASRELSRSTAASLMLLHDWLKLSSASSRFQSNLIPQDDGALDPGLRFLESNNSIDRRQQDQVFWCKWAATQYRGSFQNTRNLYWPAPSSMSIWSIDQFRRSWNKTIEAVCEGRLISHTVKTDEGSQVLRKAPSAKQRAAALAYGWITAGCAVVDANPVKPIDHLPEFNDWQRLFHRLNAISHEYFNKVKDGDTEAVRCMRCWLQNVVVLMMPEMGLPTHLMFRVLFGLDVPELQLGDLKNSAEWPNDFSAQSAHAGKAAQDEYQDLHKYYNGNIERSGIYDFHLRRAVGRSAKYYHDVFVQRSGLTESADDNIRTWLCPENSASDEKTTPHLLLKLYVDKKLDGELDPIVLDELFPNRSAKAKPEVLQKQMLASPRWLKHVFPFIRFMTENKTEIRSRRGVRLGMLQHIAQGKLTERLKRCYAVFLAAPSKHGDLANSDQMTREFGVPDWQTNVMQVSHREYEETIEDEMSHATQAASNVAKHLETLSSRLTQAAKTSTAKKSAEEFKTAMNDFRKATRKVVALAKQPKTRFSVDAAWEITQAVEATEKAASELSPAGSNTKLNVRGDATPSEILGAATAINNATLRIKKATEDVGEYPTEVFTTGSIFDGGGLVPHEDEIIYGDSEDHPSPADRSSAELAILKELVGEAVTRLAQDAP